MNPVGASRPFSTRLPDLFRVFAQCSTNVRDSFMRRQARLWCPERVEYPDTRRRCLVLWRIAAVLTLCAAIGACGEAGGATPSGLRDPDPAPSAPPGPPPFGGGAILGIPDFPKGRCFEFAVSERSLVA